jgi:hypothetical protein
MWGVYDYHRGGVCGRVYVYQGGVYVYQGPILSYQTSDQAEAERPPFGDPCFPPPLLAPRVSVASPISHT